MEGATLDRGGKCELNVLIGRSAITGISDLCSLQDIIKSLFDLHSAN